jgi:hypothetical protein
MVASSPSVARHCLSRALDLFWLLTDSNSVGTLQLKKCSNELLRLQRELGGGERHEGGLRVSQENAPKPGGLVYRWLATESTSFPRAVVFRGSRPRATTTWNETAREEKDRRVRER